MKKEPNKIIVYTPKCYMHFEHHIIYLFRNGFDEVKLSTRHCRSVVKDLIEEFCTIPFKACELTNETTDKEGNYVATLHIKGALR